MSHLAWPLALWSFMVAATSAIGLELLRVARATRAAPPEEFGYTAWLMEHETALTAAALAGLTIATALAAVAWRYRDRSSQPLLLPRPTLATVCRGIPDAVILPLGTFALVALTELLLFTAPRLDNLHPRLIAHTVGLAGLAGATVGVLGLAWFAGAAAMASLLRPSLQLAALCLGLFLGLACLLVGLLLTALGAEITALGLLPVSVAGCLLGALPVAAWTWSGLLRSARISPPDGLRGWAVQVATRLMCPFSAWAGRWAPLGAVACGGGAIVWFLGLTYPDFVDFSETLSRVWATLLTLSAVGVVITLSPDIPRARGWVAGAALLASVGAYAAGNTPDGWGYLAEYTRISRQITRWAPVPRDAEWPAANAVVLESEATLPTDLSMGKRRFPIFVLVWDAARADHMSLYGYGRQTSPVATTLAQESVVFDNAWASATATSASLRHLFTGRHSSRYMLSRSHAPFFTGALLSAGYTRAEINILGTDYNGVSRQAFVRNQPNPDVDALTGEFGSYHEEPKMTRALELVDVHVASRGGATHPGDGLFMFLHLPAPHYPWRTYADGPQWGDSPVDRYDASVARADWATGRFLAGLKARGLYQDAVVIITSDHGTGLGEHGRLGGFHPYEEQLRVPLLIRIPGVAPRRVTEPVSGIDLAPTLISMVNGGSPSTYHGHSLTPLMTGRLSQLPRRTLFAHSAFEDALAVWDIRTGDKLILHRAAQYAWLFNLQQDPTERRPLPRSARYEALLTLALGYLKLGDKTWGNPYHYSPPP